MAFLQMETGYNPFTRVKLPQGNQTFTNNTTGVVATPVPTTSPVNPVGGSTIPGGGQIQHVTIALPATVAQRVIQFPHGLGYAGDTWAPTMIWATMDQAEGSTPAAFYNIIWSKTTNQVISMQFSVTGTWHIFYC